MADDEEKWPVESYPIRMINALKDAVMRERVIDTKDPTGKTRTKWAKEFNILRSKMRKNNHPDATLVYRVEITKPKGKPHLLVLRPKNADLDAALGEAGVVAPTIFDDDEDDFLKHLEDIQKGR